MTPKEATDPKNEKKVRENIYKTYLAKRTKLVKRPTLKKGDYVRFLVKKELFSKGYEPSYSKELARVQGFGKIYVLLDNGAEFLPNELLKVKPPKAYKPKNLYSEDTLEGRLKDLAKAPVIDTGEEERLERENEKDLVEKQEKRQQRVRKKPKKFED
jgi:hypothetical protein